MTRPPDQAGSHCTMSDEETELFTYLETYLTPERQRRLREVLDLRTRHISVVLDGVFQAHNVSAALRGCEAFGVQDVHLVAPQDDLRLSSDVAVGSDKWLSIHRWKGPAAQRNCLARLRASGLRVVVTSVDPDGQTPATLDLSRPLALVIGNEAYGVSSVFEDAADERLHIPLSGFVESLNLSVACALCLSELTRRLRASPYEWRLAPEDREQMLRAWTRASIAHVEAIEQRWRSARSDAITAAARTRTGG